MPEVTTALPFPTPVQTVPPDLIYAALCAPRRRQILHCLADRKHLLALRKAGLVVTLANTVDGRRQLYGLSAHITVRRTDAGGCELDFGCCVVRC